MKLYMMRHGETAWNAENRILGITDIPLNEKGREQARIAAEKLKDIHFDVIYTSQLSRAKETGLAVAALQEDCQVFHEACLNENDFGEFEGKEYLVFAGTTSIGNNGKNTIVLFKDKLVGPHHCDINLEGSKYVLPDCGTPMGTIVNGQKTTRHVLKQGDAIAIGNSVLVFNTK